MTSTLSLGLAKLQLDGRIRRLPQKNRLDTERFRYTLWQNGPRPSELDDVTVAREMALRYFDWAGPATAMEFREFTGLSAKLVKEAICGLGSCEHDPTRLESVGAVTSDKAYPPVKEQVVSLLSSLDPWLHLRRNVSTLLEPSDDEMRLHYGVSLADVTSLRELDSHPIVIDGSLAGLWEFDHEAQEMVFWLWRSHKEAHQSIQTTGEWIAQELGDFRSFSLDSPSSRKNRLERLRERSRKMPF